MFHCEFEKKKLKQIDTRFMWQLAFFVETYIASCMYYATYECV